MKFDGFRWLLDCIGHANFIGFMYLALLFLQNKVLLV
jgi:hypothetical protein